MNSRARSVASVNLTLRARVCHDEDVPYEQHCSWQVGALSVPIVGHDSPVSKLALPQDLIDRIMCLTTAFKPWKAWLPGSMEPERYTTLHISR